jgi:hypothetical protein
MSFKVVHGLSRLGLAALLMWAAAAKAVDPATFAQDIDNYRVVPQALVGAFALALPALEIVTALALLVGPYHRGAALLTSVMLATFALAMAQAKLRGIDLACGCFGGESADPVTWTKVALDAGLAILAGWVAWTGQSRVAALPSSAQREGAA